MWIGYICVNIPENEVAKGDHLKGYVGAGPPKGTGKHRYVLALYIWQIHFFLRRENLQFSDSELAAILLKELYSFTFFGWL